MLRGLYIRRNLSKVSFIVLCAFSWKTPCVQGVDTCSRRVIGVRTQAYSHPVCTEVKAMGKGPWAERGNQKPTSGMISQCGDMGYTSFPSTNCDNTHEMFSTREAGLSLGAQGFFHQRFVI
jgi:hypothetical protein